jgi:rubrerythrin
MDIETFLAHAVQLEREAARRYEGNRELKEFFGRMAFFSRKHLAEAQARSGFREIPDIAPQDFQWPDGVAPETAAWAGVDAQMGPRQALLLALDGERSGHAYYAAVAATTADPELRALAGEFSAEEAEHVRELEKLIARCPV